MNVDEDAKSETRGTPPLVLAAGLVVLGYVFVALALDAAWLYVPGVLLELTGVALGACRLRSRRSRLWPSITVVVLGAFALLVSLIDVFFYFFFRLAEGH